MLTGGKRLIESETFVNSRRDKQGEIDGIAGTILQQFTYTRDAEGRILTMDATPSAEHWTCSCDALDRLLSSANSSDTSSSRCFSYNDAGSITSNSAIGS